MPSLLTLARWEGFILIGGFFAVVLWKILIGDVALDELFEGDIQERDGKLTTYTSAGRIQAFWVTLYVAYYYLVQVIHNPTEFPTLPNGLIAALAGSHTLYLGGKAQAMLLGRLKDFFK
ncbi:MAG TPA: hypothetical protein VJA94_10540 [Candidatus Angelobacter sp.]